MESNSLPTPQKSKKYSVKKFIPVAYHEKLLSEYLAKADWHQPFKVIMPSGKTFENKKGQPADFTIHMKNNRALADTLLNPSVGFGESYMNGTLGIEGDIKDVCELGFAMMNKGFSPSLSEKAKFLWHYYVHRNTLEGSKKNIRHHYDLGNEFYSLWLDRDYKQYTCASFPSVDSSIEEAQANKLELVCRKLQLKPGETVVEAGCGWGGLARYAAKHYGVKMKSFNISVEQVAFARERAKAEGLADNIEYIEDDYRNIGELNIKADKFVSVGMLEHVGFENYQNLFELIDGLLHPNGLALVHSIAKAHHFPLNPWIAKYIFPGAAFPCLTEMVKHVETEDLGLHVVDVENLRYNYTLTLNAWSERFEENKDKIIADYDATFYRMFLFYLRSSAASFTGGDMLLYQVLYSKGYDNSAPLTRDHMYK